MRRLDGREERRAAVRLLLDEMLCRSSPANSKPAATTYRPWPLCRAYAIDQAYEKVREIERGTVTPAMRRIEAEDPERHLAGLENRLKGRDRLAEKAVNHLKSNPELSYDQSVSKVKDAIRYTFVYSDDHYSEGVQADTRRLEARFELIDLRNSWPASGEP